MLTILIMMSLFGSIQATSTNQTLLLDKQTVNHPPEQPSTPTCEKASGGIGTQFTFTSSTTDPDGHLLYYLWDWGDGVAAEWQGPYSSGESVTKTTFWLSQNTYEVRVKAVDDPGGDGPEGDDPYRLESDWSDPCPITISKSSGKLVYRPILQNLLENLLTKFPLLRYILLIRN